MSTICSPCLMPSRHEGALHAPACLARNGFRSGRLISPPSPSELGGRSSRPCDVPSEKSILQDEELRHLRVDTLRPPWSPGVQRRGSPLCPVSASRIGEADLRRYPFAHQTRGRLAKLRYLREVPPTWHEISPRSRAIHPKTRCQGVVRHINWHIAPAECPRRGDSYEMSVSLVGPVGLEPTTYGLKVRCSAN